MSKDCQLSLTNGVSVIHYSMREKNSDYIYFQVRTVFVLLSFDKLTQRDTLYIQGKQFSYSNSEVFMTTIQPNFFAVTPDRLRVVGCHNLASARAYASGRLPNKVTNDDATTVSVTAYVSPTGQYYVMHGNQRMDVANASTARHYVKHGVAISTMLSASLSSLNQ